MHLDAPFSSLSDVEGRPDLRRQELKLAAGRIVELAKNESVDMLLICGDLYEHGYIRKSTIYFICDQFRKIPEIPVLIIPGNHDPASADSYYCNWDWPSNVHILKKNDDFYQHPNGHTRVYGGWPEKDRPDGAGINILMFHGTLDMPFSVDAYQPVSSMELEKLGFDYYAMGHFHSKIYGAGVKNNIYNPGSPEPLGFDEPGEHGVFIAAIEKEPDGKCSLQVRFEALNQRRFVNLDVHADGCASDEQIALKAASEMEKAGGTEDLYRISLQGYAAHDFRADTGCIAELLKSRAFYIRIIDNTSPDYDFERIAKEPGLRGLFTKKLLDRARNSAGAEEKRLVMQALYYGLEAIDEGSVCI